LIGVLEIILLLAILGTAGLVIYSLMLKKPVEEAKYMCRIDSRLIDPHEPLLIRAEPGGKGVTAVIGEEYWYYFFIPRNVNVDSEVMWNYMKRLAEHMKSGRVPQVMEFEYIHIPVTNIKVAEGIDLLPFDGFLVRIKLGNPDAAESVVYNLIAYTQEHVTKEGKDPGIIPFLYPVFLMSEHAIPREVITRKIELPEVGAPTIPIPPEVAQAWDEEIKRKLKERGGETW